MRRVCVDVALRQRGVAEAGSGGGEARRNRRAWRDVIIRRDAGGKGGGETEAVRGRWVVARKDKVVGLGRRRARAPISAAALPTKRDSVDHEPQTRWRPRSRVASTPIDPASAVRAGEGARAVAPGAERWHSVACRQRHLGFARAGSRPALAWRRVCDGGCQSGGGTGGGHRASPRCAVRVGGGCAVPRVTSATCPPLMDVPTRPSELRA